MVVHLFSLHFGDFEGVNVAFDTKQNVIHILELAEGTALTESIIRIQQEILDRIQSFGHTCCQTRWLLYDLHGDVTEYMDGNRTIVQLTHSDIYAAFAKTMKVRRLINKF